MHEAKTFPISGIAISYTLRVKVAAYIIHTNSGPLPENHLIWEIVIPVPRNFVYLVVQGLLSRVSE